MLTLLLSLRDCFRARAVLQAEILALPHQLLVLQRSSRLHKLRLYWADRVLWVWLSRLWNDWRSALLIVKPETVIAWHRKGFRFYWRWKSRRCEGRPSVPPEIRTLIRQMSLANPRWGAPRIHGELLKIGIEVSQAAVANYMVRQGKPPSQTWRTNPSLPSRCVADFHLQAIEHARHTKKGRVRASSRGPGLDFVSFYGYGRYLH